jgi:hypothetical protein
MNTHTIIYYRGGLYGTFIEWCLNYFSDITFSNELPFTEIGNSHKFFGNGAIISEKMFTDAIQRKCKFIRMHPGATNLENLRLSKTSKQTIECYRNELLLIEKMSDHVIFLYSNMNNVLWAENNVIKSLVEETESNVEYFKENEVSNIIFANTMEEYIRKDLNDSCYDLIKNWGKQDISNLDTWELREFLSLYLHGAWDDVYNITDTLKQEFPNVIFIEIGELRDNFVTNIVALFNKLNLPIVRDNLDFVYEKWNDLQFFKNRDNEVAQIVKDTIGNNYRSWNQLSIIDEAEIQRQLRNNGWEIKCYNLNIFPSNTKDLKKLLT